MLRRGGLVTHYDHSDHAITLPLYCDQCDWEIFEIAPELTGHGLPLSKCEAYNRVYDQFYQSR